MARFQTELQIQMRWRAVSVVAIVALSMGLYGGWPEARAGHQNAVVQISMRTAPHGTAQARGSTSSLVYGRLPLGFELNRGQSDSQVRFLARGAGYTLYLTSNAAMLALSAPPTGTHLPDRHRAATHAQGFVVPVTTDGAPAALVRLRFLGANAQPPVRGLDLLPGVANYFISNNPRRWRTNIPTFARVEYHAIYPGVDVVYYGRQGRLEYDLIVAPGASVRVIRLSVSGARRVQLDRQGNLVLRVDGREIRQARPVMYQLIGGRKRSVQGRYVLQGGNSIGFATGPYDRRTPLVIDPVLSYSTYLGSSGATQGAAIAVDGSGGADVVGVTTSPSLATAGLTQGSQPSGEDAFVAALSADGSALRYSTYLGGSGTDQGTGIAVDSSGNTYLTGVTTSPNFPILNALQATYGGHGDAFVAALSAGGNKLLYSTYLGGRGADQAAGIAVDSAGSAYVTGTTASTDFITTTSPLNGSPRAGSHVFVAKLQADGTPAYSIGLGGSETDQGTSIAVDGSGNACITGGTTSSNFPTTPNAYQPRYGGNGDAFVSVVNAEGSALLYSSYLGGSRTDQGTGIAVDGVGNAYVTGYTQSSVFPTANALQRIRSGAQDAFVTEVSPTSRGSASVAYSTYLGGSGIDAGRGIAIDGSGNAYVTGDTSSHDFPAVSAPQRSGRGASDAFVTKVQAGGTLGYSTYVGGSGADAGSGIAVDSVGNAYVTGLTLSPNFPTTVYALQASYGGAADAFAAKVGNAPFPTPTTTPTATAATSTSPTPLVTDTPPASVTPFATDTPTYPPFTTDTPSAVGTPTSTGTSTLPVGVMPTATGTATVTQ